MLISISAVNLVGRFKGRSVTGQGGLKVKNVSYLFQNVKDELTASEVEKKNPGGTVTALFHFLYKHKIDT